MLPLSQPSSAASAGSRERQRGFILAMVLAFATIIGIMITKLWPAHYVEVRRENEAELIFRGEAIARAIRLYQARTGTYPTSLDSLQKLRPRILRKLYKDPMTKDGEWDVVTAVQAGPSGEARGLPIIGVRSKSQQDSFKVYRGKTLYSDWVFSATDNILGVGGGTPPGVPPLPPGVPVPGTKGGDPGTPSTPKGK